MDVSARMSQVLATEPQDHPGLDVLLYLQGTAVLGTAVWHMYCQDVKIHILVLHRMCGRCMHMSTLLPSCHELLRHGITRDQPSNPESPSVNVTNTFAFGESVCVAARGRKLRVEHGDIKSERKRTVVPASMAGKIGPQLSKNKPNFCQIELGEVLDTKKRKRKDGQQRTTPWVQSCLPFSGHSFRLRTTSFPQARWLAECTT